MVDCGASPLDLFLRKKKRPNPIAKRSTAIDPITIPAIAPPPSLPDFPGGPAADIAGGGDVVAAAVLEVDEEGVGVDESLELDEDELPRPPGWRFR